MESIHLANYQQRVFRNQKTLLGFVIYQSDYSWPGRPAIAGATGSWLIVGMNPSIYYLDVAATREGIAELYLKKNLKILDQARNLSADQKNTFEERLWAAAAASDYFKISQIEEEMLILRTGASTLPTRPASTP